MPAKLTTSEFVARARAVHGDRYDYTLVEYKGNKNKIKIKCHEHGEFFQTPSSHLMGAGCPLCATSLISKKRMSNNDEFIKKAREVHGNKYSYLSTNYSGSHKKITITCPKHGDFYQTAGSHLNGVGCPGCFGKIKLSNSEFIARAREAHQNKYSYDSVVYTGARNKVTITCPKHGNFDQAPFSHLRGVGCPNCCSNRFNILSQAELVIFFSEKHNIVKLAITQDTPQLVRRVIKTTSFNLVTSTNKISSGKEAKELFDYAKSQLNPSSEHEGWFDYNEELVNMIKGIEL